LITESLPRYDRVARVLHWLLAVLLMAQVAFGWWLGDIPRNTPARGYYVNLHKSTGLLLGLLILARIGWRFGHRAPPLPAAMLRWQQWLAQASHFALYLCMLAVPLSGYVASNFSKYGVKFFNVVVLPPWGSDDRQRYVVFNQAHKIAIVLLLALLVVHAAAAVWHAARRDGVFSRIWLRPF